MRNGRWVGRTIAALMLVAAPGALAVEASRWGAPSSTALTGPTDRVGVATDAAGTPVVVSATLPPAVRRLTENSEFTTAVGPGGDLAGIIATDPRPTLVGVDRNGVVTTVPANTIARSSDIFTQDYRAAAIDSAGNAIVTWYTDRGRIAIASRSAGASAWSAPTVFTTKGLGPGSAAIGGQDQQVIAVNTVGEASVMWVELVIGKVTDKDPFGLDSLVWRLQVTSRPNPGAPWSDPVTVVQSDGGLSQPRIGLDRAGNAIAVWQQPPRKGARASAIRSATRAGVDGPWVIEGTPIREPEPGDFPFALPLAVSQDGHAVLAYLKGDRAAFVTRAPGGSWQTLPHPHRVGVFFSEVAIADGGDVVAGGLRQPDDGDSPSGGDLAAIPVAAVGRHGGGLGSPTDLSAPSVSRQIFNDPLGPARQLRGVGVNPDGHALVAWTDRPNARRHRLRVARFGPSEPPPAPPTPVSITSIQAENGLEVGVVAWIKVVLSRPAEDVRVTVLAQQDGRRLPPEQWTITGQTAFAPIRLRRPGTLVVRVRIDDTQGQGTSRAIRLRVVPSSRRKISLRPAPILDMAATRRRLWVLTGRYGAEDTLLHAFDVRSGQRIGRPVPVAQATHVAAGPRYAWVLTPTAAVPIDGRTFVSGQPVTIFGDIDGRPWNLAVDDRNRAWVLGEPTADIDQELVGVEPGGRVVRRKKLSSDVPGAVLGTMGIAGDVAWFSDGRLSRDSDSPGQSFRVDLRTGKLTAQAGVVTAGFGEAWRLTPSTVRRITPPSASAPRSRSEGVERLAVGPGSLWMEQELTFEEILVADVLDPRRLRRLGGANGRSSSPLEVGRRGQPGPDLDNTIDSPSFVAGPGGAWVPSAEDGVIVRVASSELPVR